MRRNGNKQIDLSQHTSNDLNIPNFNNNFVLAHAQHLTKFNNFFYTIYIILVSKTFEIQKGFEEFNL